MKTSILLTVALLIVGVSAFIALGPRILLYPAAWAVVGAVFFVWNKAMGSTESSAAS